MDPGEVADDDNLWFAPNIFDNEKHNSISLSKTDFPSESHALVSSSTPAPTASPVHPISTNTVLLPEVNNHGQDGILQQLKALAQSPHYNPETVTKIFQGLGTRTQSRAMENVAVSYGLISLLSNVIIEKAQNLDPQCYNDDDQLQSALVACQHLCCPSNENRDLFQQNGGIAALIHIFENAAQDLIRRGYCRDILNFKDNSGKMMDSDVTANSFDDDTAKDGKTSTAVDDTAANGIFDEPPFNPLHSYKTAVPTSTFRTLHNASAALRTVVYKSKACRKQVMQDGGSLVCSIALAALSMDDAIVTSSGNPLRATFFCLAAALVNICVKSLLASAMVAVTGAWEKGICKFPKIAGEVHMSIILLNKVSMIFERSLRKNQEHYDYNHGMFEYNRKMKQIERENKKNRRMDNDQDEEFKPTVLRALEVAQYELALARHFQLRGRVARSIICMLQWSSTPWVEPDRILVEETPLNCDEVPYTRMEIMHEAISTMAEHDARWLRRDDFPLVTIERRRQEKPQGGQHSEQQQHQLRQLQQLLELHPDQSMLMSSLSTLLVGQVLDFLENQEKNFHEAVNIMEFSVGVFSKARERFRMVLAIYLNNLLCLKQEREQDEEHGRGKYEYV